MASPRAKRITPEEFRERARAWLVRYTGWVSPGRDEALARELERAYAEGRDEADDERGAGAEPAEPLR